MVELGGPSNVEAVKPVLLAHLARQFGLEPQTTAAPPGLLPLA
jgi:lipoyl(octanoyl) transferase